LFKQHVYSTLTDYGNATFVQQQATTASTAHLELVSQLSQGLLEAGNGLIVQLLLPVEAGGAVVSQQLAWELGMEGLGKCSGLLKAGLRGLVAAGSG
jgi:hypothetical protein